MVSKVTLQATRITQPKAGKRITDSKGKYIKSPSVCRDGDATPAYHPWEYKTLNNFIEGKQIQCGRKSSYSCNLKTVKWIKGYRNTCPIAGCCGTFNRPAPLIIDKFNFTKKGIKKKINISKITIEFQHHVTGVDVSKASGSETKRWAGYFPWVDIILHHYSKSKNTTTEIQKIRHNTEVPLAKNGKVMVNFTKKISSFDPNNDNLIIEINYSANGGGKYYTKATNPSIIYATGFGIKADYTYVETPKIIPTTPTASISVSSNQNIIITDPRNSNNAAGQSNCRTTLTHTLRFLNTTANDVIVSVPDKVKYTKTIDATNHTITYVFEDYSGVQSLKTITYSLKSTPKQKIYKQYGAELYQKPTVTVQTKYIKNHVMKDSDKFFEIDGTCWNTLKFYINDNKTLLISFTKNDISQSAFFNKIQELQCGNYVLQVYIDDQHYKNFNISLKPAIFSFTSDLKSKYRQDDNNKAEVTITRTDSNTQDIDVKIIDTSNSTEEITTETLSSQNSLIRYIDLSTPGEYELKCEYNDGCSDKTYSLGKYIIKPYHKQSYDNLLIRATNENIEFTSVVVREGDSYQTPVTYTNATLIDSMNDIVLFAKDGLCNVGDLGYAILGVKNNTNHDIKNISIELNPMIPSEDEYETFDADIMEWKTGMLQAFNDNFFIMNPSLRNVVDIFNIQNKSLINEGTENVILRFSEIKSKKHVEIKIPYLSSYPREIYMDFLMLGIVRDFVDIDHVTNGDPYSVYTANDFISKTSKMTERGEKCISLSAQDAFSAELFIEGDGLDRNDLQDNSDLDVIYRLDLSDSECDSQTINLPIKTQIVNDAHLIPTGYQIGNQKTNIDIYDNGNIKNNISYSHADSNYTIDIKRSETINTLPLVNQNVYLKYLDKNNQIKYIRGTTDEEGYVNLPFLIPDYLSSDKYYYLEDILDYIDIITFNDDFYKEASYHLTQKHPLPQAKITLYGIYYALSDGTSKFEATPSNKNVNNIQSLYIVGQLTDADNNPLNDKIVSYYNTSSKMYKQYVTGNIPNEINTSSGLLSKDTDGYFAIPIYDASITTYNPSIVWRNSKVVYAGDVYNGPTSNINQIDSVFDRASTFINVINDYGRYREGETINISARLTAYEKTFDNVINLTQNFDECSKSIHIFYKTCSEKNEKGWKTIYRTNGGQVLANQVEKYIYCNVDTSLKIYARLEKSVVENHNVNVLSLKAVNGYKPNKNVVVKGIVAPNKYNKKLGDYLALTAIDVDNEGYMYDRSSDILYWNVGEMNPYETKKCNILLEAEHIGHNIAYICGFDYLTPDTDTTIMTNLSLEEDVQEENSHYIGSPIPLKAKLSVSDNTQREVFGTIKFYGYSLVKQCPDCGTIYPIDALTCTNVLNTNNENIECDIDDDPSICGKRLIETYDTDYNYGRGHLLANADIREFDGEYYAKGYVRLKENDMKIYARYDGMDIFSMHYEPSSSNILLFDDIEKYPTEIVFYDEYEQIDFNTNDNIEILSYIEYDGEVFSDKLDMKFFVENQEISNVQYVTKEKNNHSMKYYSIQFLVTKAGTYKIQAYLPETDNTSASTKSIMINVKDGETNDGI